MEAPAVTDPSLAAVLRDLQRIFGPRLQAMVAHSPSQRPRPSLALVQSLTLDDLTACAAAASTWSAAGAATPVVITRDEFSRSLDAFPVEFGEIIATHHVLHGGDPFEGLSVDVADLRRACEVQVRSLLLHMREDFIESCGRRAAVEGLVRDAAPHVRHLLRLTARLHGAAVDEAGLAGFAVTTLGADAATVSDLLHLADGDRGSIDAVRLFPAALRVVERLAVQTDTWQRR